MLFLRNILKSTLLNFKAVVLKEKTSFNRTEKS